MQAPRYTCFRKNQEGHPRAHCVVENVLLISDGNPKQEIYILVHTPVRVTLCSIADFPKTGTEPNSHKTDGYTTVIRTRSEPSCFMAAKFFFYKI